MGVFIVASPLGAGFLGNNWKSKEESTPLCSISVVNGEYSTSTVLTGPTAAALRIVSAFLKIHI
jgi:hypothetical protein